MSKKKDYEKPIIGETIEEVTKQTQEIKEPKTQAEEKQKLLVTSPTVYAYKRPVRAKNTMHVNTLPQGTSFDILGELQIGSTTWYKIGREIYVPEGNGYTIK